MVSTTASLIRWCTLALLLALLTSPDAQAAFPGKNGKIAFVRTDDIWTVNPDGTDRAQLTTDPARDLSPRWSPDGTQILFTSLRDGTYELYVMNADGTNQHAITDIQASDYATGSWSPDGTRLAVARPDGHWWTIAADGTDAQRVTGAPPGSEDCTIAQPYTRGTPLWSPDGTEMVGGGTWQCDEDTDPVPVWCLLHLPTGAESCRSVFPYSQYVGDWSPDSRSIVVGTEAETVGRGMYVVDDLTDPGRDLTYGDFDDLEPAWSPDGERIAFDRAEWGTFQPLLFILDAADGSNVTQLSAGDAVECCPDWQPIPVNSYPRPKSANVMEIPLVPAYEVCASPNRTHGPPLDDPSCAPPARSSAQLTVGTPDSNGRTSHSTSKVFVAVIPGTPGTPADEADLRIRGEVNDVRLASDLSDFTGSLSVRTAVRITDKDNTPHPGGPGAATGQSSNFSFPVACAATPDTAIGGKCSFNTTAEAFVPGIAKEGRRAVWELGELEVHDGDGQPFLRQGVFVP
jgi:hypothetical protein